jgi:hypothetical protein
VSLQVGELFAAGDGDQAIAVLVVGVTHVPSSAEPRPTAGSRSDDDHYDRNGPYCSGPVLTTVG